MDKGVPRHVTIIMDGNGRWAKARGKDRIAGHFEGVESVRACTECAAKVGVEYLSLFAFSHENWNRPQDEVNGLMSLMARSILNEKATFAKNNIRFKVIGDREKISSELLADIDKAMDETSHNSGLTLLVFLNYSGKWDILQACKGYCSDGMVKPFESYLSTVGIPDPDLMIRTSGEKRISNYMLWQCAYTEFYFSDILWPDFREKEFLQAIENYSSRERRFGMTSEQIQ